jgi:hypothetical protein
MKTHRIRPLYRELASAIRARQNCQASNNTEWLDKHSDTIKTLVDLLPSGAGWNEGTKIDLDASHANKIVLYGSYQHMDEFGYYDGWTEHTITVKSSLTSDIDIRISGSNRNDIKDYLYQTFEYALKQDVAYYLYLPLVPQHVVKSRWLDQCTQEFFLFAKDGLLTGKCHTFKSRLDAQSYAADLMEQAIYAPKVGV